MSRPTSQSRSSSPAPRRNHRVWLFLIVLFSLAVASFLLGTVMVARASEDPAFREHVAARLSHRLGAEVQLGEIDSNSIIFLSIPEIRVRARDHRWSFLLRRVTLELDWRLLLQREWTFRSAQIQSAELWLGANFSDSPETGPVPGNEPAAPEVARGAAVSGAPVADLPDWLKALLFRGRTGTVVGSIRIGKLSARGPVVASSVPAFALESSAEGDYARGRLRWRLRGGSFRGGDEPWEIDFLNGAVDKGVWKVESGHLLASAREGRGELRLTGASMIPGEIEVGISGVNLGGKALSGGVANMLGPLDDLTLGLEGRLIARFPEVHRFRFEGALQAEKLKLGSSRIFALLAGQTGEPRLAGLQSDRVTGRIEWTPGLVRLYDLNFEEPGLVRIAGRLSIVASEIAGVFDLELPVELVGRFPGGKPQGFSYPAAGWSRAQMRVRGPVERWSEDLTGRLIGQIPQEIPVGPGPVLESPPADLERIRQERIAVAESLSNQLIRE